MHPNMTNAGRSVRRTEANGRRMTTRRTVPGGVLLVASLLAAAVLGAQAGRKVSGVVVAAATEQPVANAQVQYEDQDGSVQTTVTDAKGRFEFPSGRKGVVTVTAHGFGTARRRWPPRRGSTLQVALAPPVAVQGTLVDSRTLRPLAGVVTALVRHPNNFVSMSAFVEDGVFRFEDVLPAPGVIVAYADDYAPKVSRFSTATEKLVDVHIRLSEDAEATGQVLDAEAKPVAGAQLIARYANTLAGAALLAGFVGGATKTGADGTFAIEGLVPNTPVTLDAKHEGRRTNTVTIEVGPGMVREDLVLRLP